MNRKGKGRSEREERQNPQVRWGALCLRERIQEYMESKNRLYRCSGMSILFNLYTEIKKLPLSLCRLQTGGRVLIVRSLVLLICALALDIVATPSLRAQKTQPDSSSSGASTATAFSQPGLTVTSNPAGALVELKGVAELAGLAPVFFSQGIPGRYELRVSKTGYETYNTTVQMSNERVEQVDVRLEPKTRGKAAIRSLLWPGWGQFYSGQKTKGAVMTTLALAAGASVVLAEIDYQNKKDDFDVFNAMYQDSLRSGSSTNLPALRSQLDNVQTDAHDAESLRRAAVGGAIAVWGISFLDALFFSPSGEGRITVNNVALTPESDILKGYTGFKLSARF